MVCSLGSMPPEMGPLILSFCDAKTLAAIHSVSKYWNRYASILINNNQRWRDLFKHRFQQELHQEETQCFAAYGKRAHPICLQNLEQVESRVIEFLCTLKWEKKCQFICSFPKNNLYFLDIQQKFGPKCGTADKAKGPFNEVSYFEFLGDLPQENPVPSIMTTCYNGNCPRDNRESGDTDEIPQRRGIPFKTSFTGGLPQHSSILPYYMKWMMSITNEEIAKVDVGYGNTLGYFSEINGWKSPFRLFCTQKNNHEHVWGGFIPLNKQFKFVIISPQNDVLWENNDAHGFKNRRLCPNLSNLTRVSKNELRSHLSSYPIKFELGAKNEASSCTNPRK